MTLTLRDIAAIYEIPGERDDLPVETVGHLKEWVRTAPEFRAEVQTLQRWADAAGVPEKDPERLGFAVELAGQLDLLLETSSWRHPAEVLDPEGELAVESEALLRLAEFRRAQGEEIEEQLLAKLREAVEQERLLRRTLERFVATLRRQPLSTHRRLLHEVKAAIQRLVSSRSR